MIYSHRYNFWKNWGEKDVKREQWNIYLAHHEYDDETKDCICGYLHGIGSHSGDWMIEKFKEIIPKNRDCIRFIVVNTNEELNNIIEFINDNNIDLFDKLNSIYLTKKFISSSRVTDSTFISEKCSIFFIEMLPDLFKTFPQNQSCYYTALEVFEYLIRSFSESVKILEAVTKTYQELKKIRRDSIYLEDRRFINQFFGIFESRFPALKEQSFSEVISFEQFFFQINLNWFLSDHENEIHVLKNQFPNIHEIFLIELIQNQEFHSIPLYLFFFERVFFLPIFSHLNAIKSSKISTRIPHLEMLEKFLKNAFPILNENDTQILRRKFKDLLESFKGHNISRTADIWWGLYGEIRCINKLIDEISKSGNKIELPDELKNNDGKVCDVRVFNTVKSSYHIYECKCKIPGHGYDGLESSCNDYLINCIPLFPSFITTCMPEFEVSKYFPNFAFSNEQKYGNLSEYSSLMVNKGFRIDYTNKELKKNTNEQKLLKDIIHCFYEEDFHISPGSLLPPEQTIIATKKQQAQLLLEKDFLKNTISNALNKFLDEKNRLHKSKSLVEKFILFWVLIIPPDLIDSPFFESNISREILKKNIEDQIQEILNQSLKTEEFTVLNNHKVELMFL